MPQLFTYTIPVDDGAAPNPFHGFCTLAICKPAIRRVAECDDWIVGLGSKNAPTGDLSKRVVYAMKVQEVLSLAKYDHDAPARWPHSIPNFNSSDMTDRLGDCIYDFSVNPPLQRRGVHGPGNRDVDIGGQNVLISEHYFYFGTHAIPLPDDLHPICHQTQGHRSTANQPYFDRFVAWITGLRLVPSQLYGPPGFIIDWQSSDCSACQTRQRDDEQDREVGEG